MASNLIVHVEDMVIKNVLAESGRLHWLLWENLLKAFTPSFHIGNNHVVGLVPAFGWIVWERT